MYKNLNIAAWTLWAGPSASYFRDPFWDPSNLDEAVRNEAGSTLLRVFEGFARTNTQTDIKQTRTSYLGTGVAD